MTTEQLGNNCRICLKTSSSMQPVTTTITDMLMMLTNLTEINMFPSNVCELCQSTLTTAYLFKKRCLDTEQTLTKLFNESMGFDSIPDDLPSEDQDQVDDNIDIEETTITSEIKIEIIAESNSLSDNHLGDSSSNSVRINAEEANSKNTTTTIITELESNEETVIRCTLCKIDFTTRKEYIRHRHIKHLRTSLCVHCGKVFSNRSMVKHMVTHTKVRDYNCAECGQRFTLKENLKKHQYIHTGEKRYECPECGMKFMHWHNKNNHIQIVHKKEKLRCKICDKLFTTQPNLTRHIRWHKGDLPYKCPHCPMKWISEYKLRRHLSVHNVKQKLVNNCKKKQAQERRST